MSLLVLGATSRIAGAIAERFAARGHALVLAGRHPAALRELAAHYAAKYAVDVATAPFDAANPESHPAFWRDVLRIMPEVNYVLLAFGTLGDPERWLREPRAATHLIDVNLTGAISILTLVGEHFRQRGGGTIIGISSVAGDRGRAKNYVYGAAKAGLTTYLSGLRQSLYHAGVHVLTVKPGFVDTPMSDGIDVPAALLADVESVADDVWRALKHRRAVVYTPWFWRPVMALIRAIPESWFARMRF